MNRLMMMWHPMAEAGGEAGGGSNEPPKTEPPKTEPPKTEPPKTEPPKTEPPKTEPPKTEPPKTEPPKTEPPKTEPPKKPVNLLDDPDGDEGKPAVEDPKAPTDEERKAYLDSIKAIDIGEGVRFDDPALDEMAPELMRLTGNDPKKAEGIVKAYTAYQQKQVRAAAEAHDNFLNGLVDECKKRFGNDLGRMCELAKAGGKAIFGDGIWNVMRKEPAFANNPDIIEKLAAYGRSVKDDPGVVRTETKPAGGDRDWRESMYGKK